MKKAKKKDDGWKPANALAGFMTINFRNALATHAVRLTCDKCKSKFMAFLRHRERIPATCLVCEPSDMSSASTTWTWTGQKPPTETKAAK